MGGDTRLPAGDVLPVATRMYRALKPACNRILVAEEIAVAALREIRQQYGKVCANYELCEHPACASSYGAWAVADKALRAIQEQREEAGKR
jgi:hypothetical protein